MFSILLRIVSVEHWMLSEKISSIVEAVLGIPDHIMQSLVITLRHGTNMCKNMSNIFEFIRSDEF